MQIYRSILTLYWIYLNPYYLYFFYIYILANTRTTCMQHYPNMFTFCQYWIILTRNVSLFHCQCFVCEVIISVIVESYNKYCQCKVKIKPVLVFNWTWFWIFNIGTVLGSNQDSMKKKKLLICTAKILFCVTFVVTNAI